MSNAKLGNVTRAASAPLRQEVRGKVERMGSTIHSPRQEVSKFLNKVPQQNSWVHSGSGKSPRVW
jgi:hypothetical protein